MNETNTQQRLRLYLIRHGEVVGAADGKLLGRTDTPLSERGLEQSRHLAEVLSITPMAE
jgi:broad specificity phosphatase PhoE